VGGTTFKAGQGCSIACNKGATRRGRTQEQMNAVQGFVDAGKAWIALDDEQRVGWNTVAVGWKRPNRVGVVRAMTGRELFIHQQACRGLYDYGADLEPPVWPTEVAMVNWTVVFVDALYGVGWNDFTAPAEVAVMFYGARHFTKGGRRRGRPVFLMGATYTTGFAQNLRTAWLERVGELEVGERFTVGYRTCGEDGLWGAAYFSDGHYVVS